MAENKPLVMVSSCLLGERVRFNGGHSLSPFVDEFLSSHAELKGFCPELMMGMGTPRPAIRLVRNEEKVTLANSDTQVPVDPQKIIDVKNEMMNWTHDCDGIILKSRSPSCGIDRVKVYNASNGIPDDNSPGVFIEALRKRYPTVPVIDEGRLQDSKLREHFLISLYAHHRLRAVQDVSQLHLFHARYKYLFMAYNQNTMRQMGRLAAQALRESFDESKKQYASLMSACLQKPATIKSAMNALTHIYGYFKNHISKEQRQHLRSMLNSYAAGKLSLSSLLQTFRFIVPMFPGEKIKQYLMDQSLFMPYPLELAKEPPNSAGWKSV